ncbi:hypothetical protein WJX72_005247 [[Myrmecia] bisecta]|uniref:Uncharacterized protein n=1 Tax=[Myrmecia] bisecta TaxID=41462 RepID=A0AAW1QR83_9CHLO
MTSRCCSAGKKWRVPAMAAFGVLRLHAGFAPVAKRQAAFKVQAKASGQGPHSSSLGIRAGHSLSSARPSLYTRPHSSIGDSGEGDEEEDELLSLSEAEALAASKGVSLPADFIEAAQAGGLRLSILEKYFALQAGLLAGFFARALPAIRDRLLSDHRFLFKVFVEVLIDSGCATVAEVRKRGSDFWNEFEFYLSDLVVGCVLDVVLVTLLAPVAVIGSRSRSAGATGWRRALSKVPSAVFEASEPGKRYSAPARVACLGVKFLEYSLAGMACGLVGQGIANSLMMARRHYYGASEDDVAVPPLVRTALTWGLFMGVSSNTRYQIVFGLERLVDLTVAKKVPQVAYLTTVFIRFVNNVIGGENFIDMARWSGIQ